MHQYSAIIWATALIASCSSQPSATPIPIEIVEGNAVTSAHVGDVQLDLVLDTGGFGGIAIAPLDLVRLDVEFTDTSIRRTDAAGDSFESREFVVSDLSLGGRVFQSIRGFERINSSSGFAGGEPMNVLGREFLHKFTVVVDYPNKQIVLHDPERGADVCGTETSELIRNEDDQFVLSISTDGGDMLALMDTGATYSFLQKNVVDSRMLEATDDFYTTQTMRIGGIEFGPLEMVVLPVEGAPKIDAFIGANFFSNHIVCFDYSKRAVSILD